MKRNEQPRAEQILTETDATRSTPGFRNIISEFARVNDSIVIEPSEDDSVGFQETDNPNFPDRPAYRLSLPSTLTVAHVIEAITHIESVSDKLPVTITSIQTARMMVASGDYIRTNVVPISKDPQGFFEIANSMEAYGEKMKNEAPKEYQAEIEKKPSDEELFTWLLGKEAYTRLYDSYHRIHKKEPSDSLYHDEFTSYLRNKIFARILAQYPSERTTHGIEQAALSREKDVMSALHKRGKRELVTKLFARTSKERRDDYTKKYGLGFPLYRAEQQELTESIKQRVGFDDAMTELTLLREQKEKEQKENPDTDWSLIKQKENELIIKLYHQVTLFPHDKYAAQPKTALIQRELNCFAKTQLLTELIQDTKTPVYIALMPDHAFCVVEFSDGSPCTFDANGFGIEPESPGYPNFFLTQQLGTDKHPTALNSVDIPLEPALLKRYAQIFEEEPPKHSLGKVCRVDETTQLQLLKYGYILIDKNGELFAKEILANDPTERYIRELLFNYYLYNNELERAKQLLTEDLRLNSLKQETTRRLWDSWQNAMFIEERYEEVFDMIKQAEYITYVQGVFPLLNSINVTKETSPNDKLPSSLLVSVISNGFDRLESSPAQEENAYFAELETQIRVIWNAGLTLTSHNLLVQEDIERYAARLTTILENGLTKFYPNKRNRKYSSTKEVYQGNIDALKIQLQNKTHEPSL